MERIFYLLKQSLFVKLALVATLVIGGGNSVWGDELTVFENATATTNNFPISGGYVKTAGIRSEYIIPRDEISAIEGKQIRKITLFHRDAKSFGGAEFKVYLKEVNQTIFTSKDFLGSYDNPVFTGVLDPSSDKKNDANQFELNLVLDTPYDYNGGDLVIGFYCSSAGTSTGYPYFYADTKTSTNYGLYTYYYNETFSTSYGYYRLKTKFTYYDASLPILTIESPASGDSFGYIKTNETKTYIVKNLGVGSMDVYISSDNDAFSLSTNSLTGITNDGSGKTIDVTFNYDADVLEPQKAIITVTPSFEGGVAQSFEVSAGPDVECNEDKTTSWTTGQGKNVYVKYTATNGWNTISFPLSVNQYKSSLFGKSASVNCYALSSYSDGILTFEKANFPGSQTPYLVYVENAGSVPFIIENVYVGYTSGGKTPKTPATFQGTFAPKYYQSGDDWYGVTSSGQVLQAGDGAYVKGYRAYFTGIQPPTNGARVSIVLEGDGTTTDLGFVKMVDKDATDVYTLSGQKVQKAGKGLYIVNGRKVVIK